jgi:hypothetical protein
MHGLLNISALAYIFKYNHASPHELLSEDERMPPLDHFLETAN